MKAKDKARNKRLTMVLRSDLTERVRNLAPQIQQNSNSFVNLCVEGCLNVMEDDSIAGQIPVIQLIRAVHRKPLLQPVQILAVCALFAPAPVKVQPQHFLSLADFLNNHEGPITAALIRFYWKRAIKSGCSLLSRRSHASDKAARDT